MKLKNKVALITGALGGIGTAIAQRFDDEGAQLALADIVEGESPITAARIYRSDLTQVAACRQLAQEIIADFGTIDVLINCVGVFHPVPFDETTEENWDLSIDVNLKGVFFLIQSVAPHMRNNGGGKVVNLTSIAASDGFSAAHAYCAAKGGLLNLTRSLAVDLAPSGINVNSIAPGFIRTPMTKHQWSDATFLNSLRRMLPTQTDYMEPEAIAGAALFLCSSDADRLHGHNLVVDDGWLAGVAPSAFSEP